MTVSGDASATAVVIPVHDRREITRACLAALAAQSVPGFTTIVVDDGSTDGTAEMIATEFPGVVVIRGDGGLWWSGATNLGVRRALEDGARFVILLNDDTLPPAGFIEGLLAAAAAKPGALIAAAEADARTHEIVWGGTRIDWLRASAVDVARSLPAAERHGLHPVTHLPGRGLVIPAEVFDEVGLFAEHELPQAAADHDLTMRAARQGRELYVDYDTMLDVLPETHGGEEYRRRPSLANYRRHLFHRRGAGNLVVFWRFALRNCPRRYLVPYTLLGTGRRLVGYWTRASSSPVAPRDGERGAA